MKYLITESQAKITATFLKLDLKRFIQIERGDSIYFVNSEDDEYAQIRYDEDNGECFIDYDLINEISSFFSMKLFDSKQVIGRWVESTLQMKVTNPLKCQGFLERMLRIPSK